MRKIKIFFLFLVLAGVNQTGFAIDAIPSSIASVNKKLKIGFLLQHLTVRGTEVATYDYADFNEKLLGNESIVISVNLYPGWFPPENPDSPSSVRGYFLARFGEHFYECDTLEEMDRILLKEEVDFLYVLKSGQSDGVLSKVTKNAVHAVFSPLEPHGDAYAAVSKWVSDTQPALNVPYVPHMARLDETTETLHEELGIPAGAVVFGRHGGYTNYNIDFAIEAIVETAQKHTDWYFVFVNTLKFCDLPNVIFLPSTPDRLYITKFINTCDAMIHAACWGETFGLTCAEFSIKNKPVITWSGLGETRFATSHVDILGNKGVYYDDKSSLLSILSSMGENIWEVRSSNWDAYSEKYGPEAIMQKFCEVFIVPLTQQ